MKKITADFEDRNDGYDDETVRYYEEISDRGYFYEVYVLIEGDKAKINITEEGVSVDFWDEEIQGANGSMMFKLTPNKLFPDRKFLEWENIEKIIKYVAIILDADNLNEIATYFTADEMDNFYKEWKTLGKP